MTTSDTTATVTSPPTASATSASYDICQNNTYWAPTVSNWAEEDVDAKLSSWALNLVPNPPTAIPETHPPTQPTLLPQIFTGFGDINLYSGVEGIPGQLMAIASGGKTLASCQLVVSSNGGCLPINSIHDACESF